MRTLTNEIVNFAGKEVELRGWVHARRDHGKIIFIDLRDRGGIAQIVFTPHHSVKAGSMGQAPQSNTLYELANTLRSEWVVMVRGKVQERPKGMENEQIPTGTLEISAAHLEVLSKAETLPISIDTDGYEIGEEVRMKYRYLDLRRPRLQKNLRMRHQVSNFCRDFLTKREFVELETPILGRSTPEGARDYLVPSRLYPSAFYALPQSPQQYKQLFMVSGFERYFQIARCFRDEDTRGDRQPEFTQLDVELSFTNQEEVMALIEELFTTMVGKLFPNHHISEKPFSRLNYAAVMAEYGTDKPDLRENKEDPNELAFAFVVNFPMFEWKDQEKRWDAVHHPFTMPQVKDTVEFKTMFKKDPAKIFAYQYDLVLNGYEIGGGSIRIHDRELLSAVFEAMGNTPEDIREKFGHLLDAFAMGVPPHGGMAPGLDRFMMIMMGEPNIREVIAFPKTGDGRDLMTGAPAEVESKQLKELGLSVEKQKTKK